MHVETHLPQILSNSHIGYGPGSGSRSTVDARSYCSTLIQISEEKKSVKQVLMSPLNAVIGAARFVLDVVLDYFCCCFCRNRKINWYNTKKIFEDIYAAVNPSRVGESIKDRQALFSSAIEALSEKALERFKMHIGMACAYHQKPNSTVGERSKWYEENKGKMRFSQDYFSDINNNSILKDAVRAFSSEIQSKV